MPKVSVVIPVYGVEKYIERCARSLFEQTIEDIEYIFVNDCTPDASIEVLLNVLEGYPARKPQTQIIYRDCNGGQAEARMIGMKAAVGEYVIHCDSDDWVELDMYEKMYLAAIENDADIVICDFVIEYKSRSVLFRSPVFSSSPKYIIEEAYKYNFNGSLWNKLIRRCLYFDNDIYPFPGINMAEDLAVTTRIYVRANKLHQLKNCFYHYDKSREGTISRTKLSDKTVDAMLQISAFIKDDLYKVDSERYALYANFLCYSSRLQIIRGEWSDWERFKSVYPETNPYVRFFSYKSFPPKAALRFFLVKYKMPYVSIFLFRIAMRMSKFTDFLF